MTDADELGTPPLDELDELDEPAGGDLTCEQCEATFDHKGRGRKPKRCPTCRKTRAPRSSSTTSDDTPTAPKRPRGIAELERQIHGTLALFGTGLMLFDSFDGQVVLSKAEKGAKALANLASVNPSVRKGLELSGEIAGWGPVLMVGFEIVMPILAHHGFLRGVPDPAGRDNGTV